MDGSANIIGFDKKKRGNIYGSADIAVQMADDGHSESLGVAARYGVLKGQVLNNFLTVSVSNSVWKLTYEPHPLYCMKQDLTSAV